MNYIKNERLQRKTRQLIIIFYQWSPCAKPNRLCFRAQSNIIIQSVKKSIRSSSDLLITSAIQFILILKFKIQLLQISYIQFNEKVHEDRFLFNFQVVIAIFIALVVTRRQFDSVLSVVTWLCIASSVVTPIWRILKWRYILLVLRRYYLLFSR